MIPVSESYTAAIKKPYRTDRITGTVTLRDGTEIDLTDNIIINNSVKIKWQICKGDMFEIGTFYTNELNIAVYDEKGHERSYADAQIVLYYGVMSDSGGWTDIPLGVFYVDNSLTKRKGKKYMLTAFDVSTRFDVSITNFEEGSRSVSGYIAYLAEVVGVELETTDFSGFPNHDLEVYGCNKNGIQTFRDLIEWCCALMGASARINRYGRLEVISLKSKSEGGAYSYDYVVEGKERTGTEVFELRALIKYVSTTFDGEPYVKTTDSTLDDEYGRNATVFVAENPLISGMTDKKDIFDKSLEGFKATLRRAEFTFHGNPAIECFDTIGAEGGEIDLGRRVAIFPTSLVWKYRGGHKVVCAFAELTDEPTMGATAFSLSSSSLTPIKTKSQIEKSIDGRGKQKDFVIPPASHVDGTQGGVWIPNEGGLDVGYDGMLTLNYATYYGVQGLGGIRPGDGLINYYVGEVTKTGVNIGKGLEFIPNEDESDPTINDKAKGRAFGVKTGKFLKIDENGAVQFLLSNTCFGIYGEIVQDSETGESLYYLTLKPASASQYGVIKLGKGLEMDSMGKVNVKSEYTAGGGIDIADGAISVNIGDGLEIGEDGKLNATGGGGGSSYTAGNGIEITQSEDKDTITAKLGEGLEFDGNGAISSVPNIQNAVIIQEKDAKYLLHEYTEVEYVAGNKIVYGGAQNSIIVQGYSVHYGTNTSEAVNVATNFPENILTYAELTSFNGSEETKYIIRVEIESTTPTSTTFALSVNDTVAGNSCTTYNTDILGFVITYRNIYGTTSEIAPYGYAYLEIYSVFQTITGAISANYINTVANRKNYAFASEAEYNAAVALTYEPQTLTQVNETVTEV